MNDSLVVPDVNSTPPKPDTDLSVLLRLEQLFASQYSPRKIYHGRIESDSAGQKRQFPSKLLFRTLTFYTDSSNGDNIHVGNSDVESSNSPPRDANVTFSFTNVVGDDLFIVFVVSGDILWWEGEV